MKYQLGYTVVHPIHGESQGFAKVVAIRENSDSEWQIDPEHTEEEIHEVLEGIKGDVVFFGEADWDADYLEAKDIEVGDPWSEGMDWSDFIPEAEYQRRQEVSKTIVKILQENGIDTNDLIVSDGKVYQGYSQCADYIQNTHAWCSSSMSC